MTVVVDASAVLAVLFAEPEAHWAAAQLGDPGLELVMSTVNLAEVLTRLEDRQPARFAALEAAVLGAGLRFVAPDATQARAAAQARVRLPLNLGDCFTYALSVAEDAPILTLDRDFQRCGRPLLAPWT
jgi:ribonuclease VapC